MAQQAPTVMPQEMMPAQHPPPPQVHQPVNNYYPENPNDLTGGLPINLDSLRDGPPGSKPFYPYSTLIRYAIKGSPNQKLLLEDIYYAIESRFPYFRTAPPGWKNSVRHNLSLNPCFEKVPRPLTDRGKGSYWTVNDNVDPRTGVHRVRKKKPKGSSKRGQQSQEQDSQEQPQASQPGMPQDVDYHPEASAEAVAAAAVAGVYPDPNYVQPPVMPTDGAGPSRQPPPYPPPYGTFDPAFLHPSMRYPMHPIFRPDETWEVDEHGNVNWAAAFRKDLQSLVAITEGQDKAGPDQEWCRQMLFRLRTTMLTPVIPPADLAQAQHGMPNVQGPADGVEVPDH